MNGIDYSFARPDPAQIKGAGYGFVCRYLSSDPSKAISRMEVAGLLAQGLTIVLVWEDKANGALGGYQAGVHDAEAAYSQAQAAGQPLDRWIYFACDFDVAANQLSAIVDYFRGVGSIIGMERTAFYGPRSIYLHLKQLGLVIGGWEAESTGWSGYAPEPADMHIWQTGQSVFGGQADINQAMQADFGQWPYQQEDDVTPEQMQQILDAVDKKPVIVTWRCESSRPDGRKFTGHVDTGKTKLTELMVMVHAAMDPDQPAIFGHVHVKVYVNPDQPTQQIVQEVDVPTGTNYGYAFSNYAGQISVDIDQPNAAACYMRELY